MTRITPRVFRARWGFLEIIFIFSLSITGCLSTEDRSTPSELILFPASSVRGDVISVTLTLPKIKLDKCDIGDTEQSLEFVDSDGTKSVTVHSIDRLLLSPDSLRAYIAIDSDAALGKAAVSFKCNKNTVLTGSFRIEDIPSEITLTASPETVAAGSFGRVIIIKSNYPFFTDDTEFFFSWKDYIKVTNKRRLDAYSLGQEVEITLDIDPLIPLGDLRISASSSGRIAEGIIRITDRVNSTVNVTPDRVQRQSVNETGPPIYDVMIEGEGIDFVRSDNTGSETDQNKPLISFPENPGITVLDDVQVIELTDDNKVVKAVKAQIRVDSLATLGVTPLYIKSGKQEAWTNFTVLLPSGTPMLKIVGPRTVSRNGVFVTVFVDAINFTFEGMKNVICKEAGCAIQNITVDPIGYKSMSMEVRVAAESSDSYVTVEVEMPDFTVREYLATKASDASVLILNPNSIKQGDRAQQEVFFTFSDGTLFSANPTVQVSPRSGLRINKTALVSDMGSLIVWFDVADDAPTGPSYISVGSGGNIYAAPLRIEAISKDVPQMTLLPGAILRKRDTILIRVQGTGFDLPSSIEGYSFDDPGLKISSVNADSDGSVLLTVEVSPLARKDMAVLYAKSLTGQAAVTFRTLEHNRIPILRPEPVTVSRMAGGGNTSTITIYHPDIVFDMPVVDVNDNIGAEVMRVSGGQSLVFDLRVDPVGLGGWIGLTIKNGAQNYLAPILIDAGGDSTLTARMNPEMVFPGTERLTVTAVLPSGMKVDPGILSVHTAHPGAYVSKARSVSENSVVFILDVTHNAVELGGNQIPIYITTSDGAGLGYIFISGVSVSSISDGQVWQGVFNAKTFTNFRVEDPGPFPSFLQIISEDAVLGDPLLTMTADNNLNIAGKSDNGLIWMMNKNPRWMSIYSEQGLPFGIVNVRSQGRKSTEENVTADDNEWIVKNDPCKTPFLGRGAIQGALDVDTIRMEKPTCRLISFTAARDLADRPWETPDLKMRYWEVSGIGSNDSPILIGEDSGGLRKDPILTVDPGIVSDDKEITVTLSGEMGSTGAYMVQIRRPYTIQEFSADPDSPFIEIAIPKDADLSLLEIVLIDTETDVEIDRYVPASDSEIVNDGIIVISGTQMEESDAVHNAAALPSDSSFAIQLFYAQELLDAVQVGRGTVSYGEGNSVITNTSAKTFFRIANIDTNDNASDFAATYIRTPGK